MKKLLVLFLLCLPAFAALPTTGTTYFEIRTGGNIANGGCFIQGSSGTDRSQQAAAYTAYTDLVIGGTTTQLTSAASPFSAADVGNCIKIVSGAGCTTGWYYVVSVSVVTATMDRSVGTGASTCTGNLGGAITYATLNSLGGAGYTFWVKADATYTVSTDSNITTGGSTAAPMTIQGYTTTRGDGGKPTLQASGSNLHIMLLNATDIMVQNFIFDCNAQTNCAPFTFYAQLNMASNIEAKNGTSGVAGIFWNNSYNWCLNCWSHDNTGSGFGMGSNGNAYCVYCQASNNTVHGFTATNQASCEFCIAANNGSGTTNHGFSFGNNFTILVNSVAYGNTGAGLNMVTNNRQTIVNNNIFVNNATYGITNATGTAIYNAGWGYINHNAFYNNTTAARNNFPVGDGDVTLTGDPFTNAASNDFTLNNTAGAGASLRAAGFPGVQQFGGTSYLDFGPLQAAASASTLTIGTPLQ